MSEPVCIIDYETRSRERLPIVGPHKYCEDRMHQPFVIAMAMSDNDDPPVVLDNWNRTTLPDKLAGYIQAGGKLAGFGDFDRIVTNRALERMGLPPLAPGQYIDIRVQCLETGLPSSLLGAGLRLNCKHRKMDTGKELIKLFCIPSTAKKTRGLFVGTKETHPEQWASFLEYGGGDVEVARELYNRLPKIGAFSEHEQDIYDLHLEMSDKGVRIDIDSVTILNEMREALLEFYNESLERISKGAITATGQVSRIAAFCGLPGSSKEMLTNALASGQLNEDQAEVARLRLLSGKTSLGKLNKMLLCSLEDGRSKGTLAFHGTVTARFSGSQWQPHNLPRKTWDADKVEACVAHARQDLEKGAAGAFFREQYESPVEALSQCLRGMIIPDPGCEFIVADYSAIECRINFWLAGQHDAVEAYRTGEDLYRIMAGDLFNCKPEDVDQGQRFIGKTLILGSGYGLGAVGLHRKLVSDGILEDTEEGLELAKSYTYGFRDKFPRIVSYWRELTEAFHNAMKGQASGMRDRGLTFGRQGSAVFLQVGSGKRIFYHNPKIEKRPAPWDPDKLIDVIVTEPAGMGAPNIITHATLSENAASLCAREILTRGLVNLARAGYGPILSVHDEAVLNVPINFGDLREVAELMTKPLPWTEGLPLAVEGARMRRYGK